MLTTTAGRNPRECAEAKNAHVHGAVVCVRRNPRECAVAKLAFYQFICRRLLVATRANALWQRWVAIQIFSVVTSQPARMRCGKVAPLLCPNRKLRKHELRSSFLVSPPVILVATFYMTAQLLKRFNTCTAKTAASKLSGPMRRCILLISEPVSTEPAGIMGLFPLANWKRSLNFLV